jgi:hypothetical protein
MADLNPVQKDYKLCELAALNNFDIVIITERSFENQQDLTSLPIDVVFLDNRPLRAVDEHLRPFVPVLKRYLEEIEESIALGNSPAFWAIRTADVEREQAILAAQQELLAANSEIQKFSDAIAVAEAERVALEDRQRKEHEALEAEEAAKVAEARKESVLAAQSLNEAEERERRAEIEVENAKLEAERTEEFRRAEEQEAADRIQALVEEEAAKIEALKFEEEARKEELIQAEADLKEAERMAALREVGTHRAEDKLKQDIEAQSDAQKIEENRKELEKAQAAEVDAIAKEQQATSEMEKAKVDYERAEIVREKTEKESEQRIEAAKKMEEGKVELAKSEETEKQEILYQAEQARNEASKEKAISEAAALMADDRLRDAEINRDATLGTQAENHDREYYIVEERITENQQALDEAIANFQDRQDVSGTDISDDTLSLPRNLETYADELKTAVELKTVEAGLDSETPQVKSTDSKINAQPGAENEVKDVLGASQKPIADNSELPSSKVVETDSATDTTMEYDPFVPQPLDSRPTTAEDRLVWAYDQVVGNGQQASSQQMEEVRHLEEKQFNEEQENLLIAAAESSDPKVVDRLELRAELERADKERLEAINEYARLKDTVTHESAPEILDASDMVEDKGKKYESLYNEWGQRAVFDDRYDPIDEAMREKIEDIKNSEEFLSASDHEKAQAEEYITKKKSEEQEKPEALYEKSDKERELESKIMEAFPNISGEAFSAVATYAM